MSFLAGRLAGKEGAFFFHESKHAVNRLAEKSSNSSSTTAAATAVNNHPSSSSTADILPEVLRHSLPSKIFGKPYEPSSFSTASKWTLPNGGGSGSTVSADALNPLRAYVSVPHVTFGPKRWQLPNLEHEVRASTANEMRKDRYTPMNPKKLKAAAEGLAYVGKAFAVATAIVFGGATVVFGLVASQLELRNTDDIRFKAKDRVQPKLDVIREQLVPLRIWAEGTSKKWHINTEEDLKQKPIIKELSKILGAKPSD